MKIAVGLSGGVDSSVVAHMLKQEGHEVVGKRMNLFPQADNAEEMYARKVADHLGIEFVSLDMASEFQNHVVQYLKEEYTTGRTPNPCVICNRYIKFGLFLDKILESGLDFDMFTTGHYAIIERDHLGKRYLLKKGSNTDKDQAYFLSMLSQEQLGKILFPLGRMSKVRVKEIASQAGLFTAEKRESQDLCAGDYRQYLDKDKSNKGYFLHKNGEILGSHQGIENYTIGQRRGLGLSSSHEPYYVIGLDSVNNNVIVGYNSDLLSDTMTVGEINWGSVENPQLPVNIQVKIRYRDDGVASTIEKKLENGNYLIRFAEKRRAVTPGQLAVFYVDDIVLGAAFINSAAHSFN